MVTVLVCPHCGQPVSDQERDCSSCGVNLALAAGYAASTLTVSLPLHDATPMAPEILVPRLGEILLEKGVLTSDQLQTALDRHKEILIAGRTQLFGQLLLEMGLINRGILDQVVTEQILKLQQALQFTNQKLEQRVIERTHDLQEALHKLSELNELKSNFVSNISHELRTPLTHIKGYLNLLAENALGPLTDEQADALAVVLRAEARLEQLIEDLIQFSLVARGQLSLNLSVVDVKELVSIAVKKVESHARTRQVKMGVNLEYTYPPIRVDAEKIIWVLMQLLDNAIKFTSQGGSVQIYTAQDNNLISIGVIDTGIGIPPEKLAEIFEPFYQLDGGTTRHFSGTGLGLALVKRIVEAHGGLLKVSSTVGKGSCFEFSLPTSQSENLDE